MLQIADIHRIFEDSGVDSDAVAEAESYLAYCQSEVTRAQDQYGRGEIKIDELVEAQQCLAAAESQIGQLQ